MTTTLTVQCTEVSDHSVLFYSPYSPVQTPVSFDGHVRLITSDPSVAKQYQVRKNYVVTITEARED